MAKIDVEDDNALHELATETIDRVCKIVGYDDPSQWSLTFQLHRTGDGENVAFPCEAITFGSTERIRLALSAIGTDICDATVDAKANYLVVAKRALELAFEGTNDQFLVIVVNENLGAAEVYHMDMVPPTRGLRPFAHAIAGIERAVAERESGPSEAESVPPKATIN